MTRKRETGGVYKRGDTWWIHYRVDGERYFESADTGDERAARSLLAQRRREIRDGTWTPPGQRSEAAPAPAPAVLTVRAYLAAWVERRKAAGVRTVRNDALFFETHVNPAIGDLALVDVTRVHVRDLVGKVSSYVSKATGETLSPRYVLHVYRTLATAMHDAVLDGLIPATPCTLRTRRGELPKLRDKDPKWRAQAVYSREEAEQMLTDARIPPDRRMIYGLQLLGGLRAMEAAGRRWQDYDATAKPLGRLVVATQADGAQGDRETKTGEIRDVPVHPTLARMLETWRREGFPMLFGRRPDPEDPIVPSRNDVEGRCFRTRSAMYDRLLDDVTRIKLRRVPALQHSMRATFLSLLELDGANMAIARRATHAAPSDVVGGYIRVRWEDLCREIAKLQIGGNVVSLAARRASNDHASGDSHGDSQAGGAISSRNLLGVAGVEATAQTGIAGDSRDTTDTGPSAAPPASPGKTADRDHETQSVTKSVTPTAEELARRLAALDPERLAKLLEALDRERED